MKKFLFIDLDNTLIDFNECARHSIINAFEELGFTYTENVFKTFIEENVKIWKRLEKGEITKAELRTNRWNIILGKLGIDFDGTVLEEMFENGVAKGAYAVEGAYDLLDYLYGKYKLYIVSNGFRFVQESRLKIGNFEKYFYRFSFINNIYPSDFFSYCYNPSSFCPIAHNAFSFKGVYSPESVSKIKNIPSILLYSKLLKYAIQLHYFACMLK